MAFSRDMLDEDDILETLTRNGFRIASFQLNEKCHFGIHEKLATQSPCFDKNLAVHRNLGILIRKLNVRLINDLKVVLES